jgi:hypothetical protein
MTPPPQAPPSPICDRCGHPQNDHWVVNFSDGPHVGGPVWVCPTAIFKPTR